MNRTWIFVSVLLAVSPARAGWKTEFGAEDRARAEYRGNFDFDDAKEDDGWQIFQRLRLTGKAAADNYTFYAEAADLRVASVELPKADQSDELDLHQAYFAADKALGPLSFSVGRQELKYGKNRLIGAAPWNNRINHEDAAVLKYKEGPLAADAFYGWRVSWDRNGWNDPNRHDRLAGVYATWQQGKDSPLVDAYLLANYDGDNLSTLNRRTAGLRVAAGLPAGLALDAELPYQFGKASGKRVYAWAFHAELSRGFDLPWKPRATAAYNYASGDKDKNDSSNNSFVPLYQSTHYGYGLMDFFRWENMKEAALEVAGGPDKKLNFTLGTNFFWLASVHDSWYDSAGRKLRTLAAGRTARPYVGQELSLMARYDFGGGLNGESGCAHFFSGAYVKDTGAHDDADWFYLQLNMKL